MGFHSSFATCFNLIVVTNYLVACTFSQAHGTTPSSTPIVKPNNKTSSFTRNSFPPHFLFGSASSAYQYEGAVKVDGRGPSFWDTFTQKYPEKILDGSNGDVAQDFYHRYKGDIKLMKSSGLDAFRLSISWSRLAHRPTEEVNPGCASSGPVLHLKSAQTLGNHPQAAGKVTDGVNKKGVEFYNRLINELISNGIKLFVTIYHWDIPQPLQDEYAGFASPRIINDYLDFADICFKEFGDRVQHWMTHNEPFMYSKLMLVAGFMVGDLAKDPYLVAHHILLSHAKAVQLYRTKYKSQNGQIGIVLNSDWMLPYSNSKEDIKATQRNLDFMLGWFMGPLTNGEYPKVMQNIVGSRLPKFNVEEAAMVKGSYDFLGLNYYTGGYVQNVPSNGNQLNVATDPHANQTFDRRGALLIGQPTGGPQFYVYPKGLHHLLVHIKKKYHSPTIYITENGMPDSNNNATTKQLLNDHQRVDFLHGHLISIKEAIKDGVNVRGYFVWSFMDTWEWNSGFTIRFGLNFIDYKNGLKRIPKLSGKWLKAFLKA